MVFLTERNVVSRFLEKATILIDYRISETLRRGF